MISALNAAQQWLCLCCRVEVVSWKPRAFLYHNFLSDEEAEHMKQLAAPTVSSGCMRTVSTLLLL
jgi:hypothetical protein